MVESMGECFGECSGDRFMVSSLNGFGDILLPLRRGLHVEDTH